MNMKNLTTSINSGATGLTIEAISSLYSHPASSAVREVLSNALDAHTEAGVDNSVPVDVFIEPGHTSTRVVITDHGAGMSPETVETSFLNVEVSNKRENEKLIGGHGIGIFSVLSATPTVSVVTTHGDTTTYVVGTNAGEGNLLWTVNTVPAGDTKPGTIVDMTVTPDPTTADFVRMYDYVVTAAFTRNVRVRERSSWLNSPLRNDYMNRFGSSNSIYADHTGDTVFYPYGADKNPKTMGYLDVLHTIGTKYGVYVVPNICISQRSVEGIGGFAITINGIPYEPHISMNPGTSCHTFVTEQWFNKNTGKSVTKIPRSREYVELTSYPDISPLRMILEQIYEKWTDEERNSIASAAIDRALKDTQNKDRIIQPTFRESLFCQQSVDVFIEKEFGIDIKKAKKSYKEVTEIESAVKDLITDTPDYLVRLLDQISTRTPRATLTCPHAATNSNVESIVSAVTGEWNQPLTLGMAMEVVAVLAAEHNYKTYGTGTNQSTLSKFSFLSVQDMPENPPAMLDKKQRTSLAIFTGRKGVTHVMHPEVDAEMHTLAMTAYNIANIIIGQISPKFTVVLGARWGSEHAYIHSSTTLYVSLDMMNGRIEKAPDMTWKTLTTSEKKKNTVRTWPFKRYLIDENGRCVYQGDVQVSAKQAADYDKDEHVLFTATTPNGSFNIPNLGDISSSRSYYRRYSPFESMDQSFDENDEYQSDACYGRKVLHDNGVRDMYLYHHETNKTPSSAVYTLARTSWHKLWTQIAVPAMNERNEKNQKKSYTPYVLERLVTFNGNVDFIQFPWIIYRSLVGRSEANSKYSLFGNYANPIYLDILNDITDKLPDDVPERFVRPLYDETRRFTSRCYGTNSLTDSYLRGIVEEIAGDKGAVTYDMLRHLYLSSRLSNVMGFLASYSMSVQTQEVRDIIKRGNKELERWGSDMAGGEYSFGSTIPQTRKTSYIKEAEVKALRGNEEFEKMRKEYVEIAVPVIAHVWQEFSTIVNHTYKEIGSSYTIDDYYEVVKKVEERVVSITAPIYSDGN